MITKPNPTNRTHGYEPSAPKPARACGAGGKMMDNSLTAYHKEYSLYSVKAFLSPGIYRIVASNEVKRMYDVFEGGRYYNTVKCDWGDTVHFENLIDNEWVEIRPAGFELEHIHIISKPILLLGIGYDLLPD